MSFWAYGRTDQGQEQLHGPFETQEEADGAGADLSQVRIIEANTREEAIAQLKNQAKIKPQKAKPELDDWDALEEELAANRRAMGDE